MYNEINVVLMPANKTDSHTIALVSHTSKVMLKILQAWLQQYVNCELPNVHAGFRKGRGTRDQLPTSAGSLKKQESSRKTSISALLTTWMLLTVWIKTNYGKSSRDGNTRPHYLPPEKSVCRSRSNSETWTWNNRLIPNRERSTSRLYIVTLLI